MSGFNASDSASPKQETEIIIFSSAGLSVMASISLIECYTSSSLSIAQTAFNMLLKSVDSPS